MHAIPANRTATSARVGTCRRVTGDGGCRVVGYGVGCGAGALPSTVWSLGIDGGSQLGSTSGATAGCVVGQLTWTSEVDFGCGGGHVGSISSDMASSREVPTVDEEFAELLRRVRALAPLGEDIL